MKANLTRGNSITDFTDWIEECIYNELKAEYFKELERQIKIQHDQIVKEMMGPSEPIGIFNYPTIIGIKTNLPTQPFPNLNDFFSA
jgi:hypothetical protein